MNRDGSLIIADTGNSQIKRVSTDKVVSIVAGSGTQGATDGPALQASFLAPSSIALDMDGGIYVVDTNNSRIRLIMDGGVSTFAGPSGVDTDGGYAEGPRLSAQFYYPRGIAISPTGVIYVGDSGNGRLRAIRDGIVTTLAGTGDARSVDGRSDVASLNAPRGLALDASGNIYVAESGGNRIRKVTPDGFVTTLAGNGDAGSDDGPGSAASFNRPSGVAVDSAGNVYASDFNSHLIRKLTLK